MARKTKPIDVDVLNNILSNIQEGQFPNALKLCTFAAEEYNRQKGNEYPELDHQLVRLRIVNGVVDLGFPLPKGKRGISVLSTEHKEKMLGARKQSVKKEITNNEDWENNMREFFPNRLYLADGIINGNRKDAIHGFCILCMGGDRDRTTFDPRLTEAIRDCKGFHCPLYKVRPYQ